MSVSVGARPVEATFLHANGFPAGAYRRLFAHLGPRFKLHTIETLGTDPAYPVTDGWPHLIRQLIDRIGAEATGPVLGIGHSLGGIVTFGAALQRPDLFRAVILIDSPLIGPVKSRLFGWVKRIGLAGWVTDARRAERRRSLWPSRAAALEHLRGRRVFGRFEPESLAAYVSAGTVEDAEGVRLRIAPQLEARIYRTIPHSLSQGVARMPVPAGLIIGRESNVVRRLGLAASRRLLHVREVAGSHLFPFEHPGAAARAIESLAEELGVISYNQNHGDNASNTLANP